MCNSLLQNPCVYIPTKCAIVYSKIHAFICLLRCLFLKNIIMLCPWTLITMIPHFGPNNQNYKLRVCSLLYLILSKISWSVLEERSLFFIFFFVKCLSEFWLCTECNEISCQKMRNNVQSHVSKANTCLCTVWVPLFFLEHDILW